MKLWRISNYADLKGIGGLQTAARWHNKGIPVVYLAESPSLAMLEVLVHFEMDADDMPQTYQLLEVDYPLRKGVSRLSTSNLIDGWEKDITYTRAVGDDWLSNMSGVLLKVPSVVAPKSFNYLYNPRHELASNAKIINVSSYPFDDRLI